MQEPELVKVVGIRYEIKPPRLCCLRFAIMKQNGRLTNDMFTIKYHDMPDVIDFLVLRQTYDTALARQWKVGKLFEIMHFFLKVKCKVFLFCVYIIASV